MRKGLPKVLITSFKYIFHQRTKCFVHGYLGKEQDIHEKRNFPRYPATEPIICFRYGREMTMRAQNISLEGLKVTANFNLWVGESMDLAILTNGPRIYCRGRILAVEELRNKVHARLRFAPASDTDSRKLSNYLDSLSRGRFHTGVILGLFILLAYIASVIIRTYFFQ